ncbi:isopentenyl-diphosphate Delta-isomerase [Vibrio hippocampi]|uniref:Isopentenyl-diphosphate Delta-isomerase n=1 Tax=Vibrio hippocampi TaxID=654686 RepID=A0ABM8ZM98_9VIBR|nr:isopentenyl-diphosphate Delta-isomerase [Vibrio hippocampi]CAH0529666.1 Isopentenyl-diphosphate Delta-isomerase [Vibrio hippocampi]
MQEDLVVILDRLGNPIGEEEKLAAHQTGLRHLAFSVLLYRIHEGNTQYLLQQRAHYKYHSGDLWSNTCCSHPRPNEKIIKACQRRLVEEMGISAKLNLEDIGQISYRAKFANGLTENELDHVVIAQAEGIEWQLNPDEAQDCRWWSAQDIAQTLESQPETFSAWFRLVFDKAEQHLNKPD